MVSLARRSILLILKKMVTVYWTMRKNVIATTMAMFLGALQMTMGITAAIPTTGIMMKAFMCLMKPS